MMRPQRRARARTHRIVLPGAFPGVLLRVALLVVPLLGALAIVASPVWIVIAGILAAIGAAVPRLFASYAALVVVVVAIVAGGPSAGATALAVLVLHLTHVLAALALIVPAFARVTVRALRPTLIRFVAVQLVSQAVALLAVVLPTGVSDAWLAVLGAAALLALAAVILLATRPSSPSSSP